MRDVTLDETQARALLRRAVSDDHVRITAIAERNHVWRLQHGSDTSFLKIYTKDWYGDDPARTSDRRGDSGPQGGA